MSVSVQSWHVGDSLRNGRPGDSYTDVGVHVTNVSLRPRMRLAAGPPRELATDAHCSKEACIDLPATATVGRLPLTHG
jgi:hypothetical protein